MAEQKKKLKLPSRVSPQGIAKYCWLDKPDAYNVEMGGKPEYKVRLLLKDTEENRAWVESTLAEAQAFAKENGIKLKKQFKNPFQFPEDQDEDDFIPQEGKDKPKLDEDYRGKIVFNAKSAYKAGLIDSAKQELPEDVKIMSGDIIKAKIQLNPYEGLGSGISFRLVTVQLIDKRTSFSGGGVNTEGFDEEDGYIAPRNSRPDDEDEEQF